jgi:hypothetical protein
MLESAALIAKSGGARSQHFGWAVFDAYIFGETATRSLTLGQPGTDH